MRVPPARSVGKAKFVNNLESRPMFKPKRAVISRRVKFKICLLVHQNPPKKGKLKRRKVLKPSWLCPRLIFCLERAAMAVTLQPLQLRGTFVVAEWTFVEALNSDYNYDQKENKTADEVQTSTKKSKRATAMGNEKRTGDRQRRVATNQTMVIWCVDTPPYSADPEHHEKH